MPTRAQRRANRTRKQHLKRRHRFTRKYYAIPYKDRLRLHQGRLNERHNDGIEARLAAVVAARLSDALEADVRSVPFRSGFRWLVRVQDYAGSASNPLCSRCPVCLTLWNGRKDLKWRDGEEPNGHRNSVHPFLSSMSFFYNGKVFLQLGVQFTNEVIRGILWDAMETLGEPGILDLIAEYDNCNRFVDLDLSEEIIGE